MDRITELAERIYELIDPWEREVEPDDIAGHIIDYPLEVIEYLVERLEG